jgi:hypothetical protein
MHFGVICVMTAAIKVVLGFHSGQQRFSEKKSPFAIIPLAVMMKEVFHTYLRDQSLEAPARGLITRIVGTGR